MAQILMKRSHQLIYYLIGTAFLVRVPWSLRQWTFHYEKALAFIMSQDRAIATETDFISAEARMLKRGSIDKSVAAL